MKNTNIKIFLKILWYTFVIICIIAICAFGYLILDKKSRCLDLGQIYDPKQKICRTDCLTWDKRIGCIPITKENIKKKEKGLSF